MAQSGYTPILVYGSSTASAVPSAANLTSSANGAELALNYNDGKLYYKNNSGTVTLLSDKNAVSVASANGFAGSVAKSTATSTPAITISTSVTGILKGNGTAISAASSGTDYAPATSGTSILYGNGSGGFSNVTIGSGISFVGGTLSSTGSGGSVTSVSAGTGMSFSTITTSGSVAIDTAVVPRFANAGTFTALQTFSGSTSVAAVKLPNAKEVATVSATAATGTINYDVTTQSVLYYTSNASGNWTVNFRGSSGTSLDTLMSTGESMTVAFLVTQGSTAYYNNAVQVDGSAVTPKYQGGTAWTAGNVNAIDAYVYTIVKTGSATFTVFVSQTEFA